MSSPARRVLYEIGQEVEIGEADGITVAAALKKEVCKQ
jgi:hypothetical protein